MSHSVRKPLFLSYGLALFSLWVAQRYFLEVRQMAACALIALGLSTLLSQLLESNRQMIWQEKISPWVANRRLAFEFSAIFVGIFTAAVAVAIVFNKEAQSINLAEIYANDLMPLFWHNFGILITGAVLAIVYRAGGLVLILAWNALHWADAIFSYVRQIYLEVDFISAALTFAAILPHLVLEALAYVVAGLAGVFISIALFKYRIGSAELQRVAVACLTLLAVSLGVLLLATAVEVYLGQQAFHELRAFTNRNVRNGLSIGSSFLPEAKPPEGIQIAITIEENRA